MLQPVPVGLRNFTEYHPLIEPGLFEEVYALAKRLEGKRVLHINSTSSRGGVAEILESSIPLMRDVGLDAHWQTFKSVPNSFYRLTKLIHNGLQGGSQDMTPAQWRQYEAYNRRLAKYLQPSQWDYIVVHDHQPAAALSFLKSQGRTKWIWRSHTDSANPNPSYQKQFLKYLNPFDGALFTMPEYVFNGYRPKHLMISPPAIDAFSTKNAPLKKAEARRIVRSFGIDTTKPLITQVSRLDPWKDMPGVVAAWQLAKKRVPNLQLALISNYSTGDAQALGILKELRKTARGMPDLYLMINEAGPRAIKAFRMVNNVALQKSLREGFGLTVAEALWSKRPVIGGNVGGIKLQIAPGKNGYLVNSVEECAKWIVNLVQNPAKAYLLGQYGHEHVRRHFLLPRMIRDTLQFMLELG